MKAARVVFLLTFGAFAGTAQTLTCTFQFVGSGTVGTQSFTNADITITTVAFTANINQYAYGPPPDVTIIGNTSTSIAISGVGTFQFLAATEVVVVTSPAGAASGTFALQAFELEFSGDYVVVESTGSPPTIGPWTTLTSYGPVTLSEGYVAGWNVNPVITTSGYTLSVYTPGNYIPITFQAVFTPGVPCAGTPSGNVADVQEEINEALGTSPANADMNGDGVVNVVDVQLVTNAVLGCGVSGTTPASFRSFAHHLE
jgi:hypothetical protein